MSVLFTWLGLTDIKAFRNDDLKGGPIPRMLLSGNFTEAVIISDWGSEDNHNNSFDLHELIEWLKSNSNLPIKVHLADIRNPVDLASVYENSRQAVENYLEEEPKLPDFCFNLSSGTWAMSVAWTLLSKTRYINAQCWASAEKIEPSAIEIPFEISHEFYTVIERQINKNKQELIGEILIQKNNFYNEAVFTGDAMLHLYKETIKAAEHPYPVLITGELGTEKSVFAEEIHKHDATRTGQFIAVFCGADHAYDLDQRLFGAKGDKRLQMISEERYGPSLVTQAKGGTLYLEDIDVLSSISQTSLLGLLQKLENEHRYLKSEPSESPRIIVSSKTNLFEAVENGRFSEQLYFKLTAVTVKVPSLHERGVDVLTIARNILDQVNSILMKGAGYSPKKFTITSENFIRNRKWPGNLFELENTIKRAALSTQSGEITEDALIAASIPFPETGAETEHLLDQSLGEEFRLKDVLDEVAKRYLEKAHEQSGGNASAAYKLLGLGNYQTYLNWYNRYVVNDRKA